MITNENLTDKTAFISALLRELTLLLVKISFTTEKGCYEKTKNWRVLVDIEPATVAGAFDAGITIFPMVDEQLDLGGIEIATTGRSHDHPNIRPFRKLATNKRGCITFKDLPTGSYRLLLAKSMIVPNEPLAKTTRRLVGAQAVGGGGRFDTSGPARLLFRRDRSEDGSLMCALRETSEGKVLLEFETESSEENLSVEYAIVRGDTEEAVTITRDGVSEPLADRVALKRDSEGKQSAQVSLGYDFTLPDEPCYIRAYLVPGSTPKKEGADGSHRGSLFTSAEGPSADRDRL